MPDDLQCCTTKLISDNSLPAESSTGPTDWSHPGIAIVGRPDSDCARNGWVEHQDDGVHLTCTYLAGRVHGEVAQGAGGDTIMPGGKVQCCIGAVGVQDWLNGCTGAVDRLDLEVGRLGIGAKGLTVRPPDNGTDNGPTIGVGGDGREWWCWPLERAARNHEGKEEDGCSHGRVAVA